MNKNKKMLSIVFASLLLVTIALLGVAMAAPEPGSESEETVATEASDSNGDMKENPVATGNPPLTAKSAICIDAQTGKILYARNIDERRYPASTTKIMTMILALENGKLDSLVTTPEEAFDVEGSSLYLEIGEKMTLQDLLYGIALISGNDATIAVAHHIAGSVPAFVGMMNRKAAIIGANNTNFVNPNGLPADNHYSTAHDLAIITAYAYNNVPGFHRIVSTEECVLPTNATGIDRSIQNENRMLWQYKGCVGVKTGFTEQAGRCFVGAAERDGMRIITVVLDAEYMFTDTINLLNDAFSKLTPHVFAEAGKTLTKLRVNNGSKGFMAVHTNDDVVAALNNDLNRYEFKIVPDARKLDKNIHRGEVVGKVQLLYDGKVVQETDLLASENINRKSFFRFLYNHISSLFA